jgi:hypothetical protein
METPGYDPLSIHNIVDDIYSSHAVQDYMRAQRSMRSEASLRRRGKTIIVTTIMNDYVAELFGKRTFDVQTPALSELDSLYNDSAAQDEVSVVEDS